MSNISKALREELEAIRARSRTGRVTKSWNVPSEIYQASIEDSAAPVVCGMTSGPMWSHEIRYTEHEDGVWVPVAPKREKVTCEYCRRTNSTDQDVCKGCGASLPG